MVDNLNAGREHECPKCGERFGAPASADDYISLLISIRGVVNAKRDYEVRLEFAEEEA